VWEGSPNLHAIGPPPHTDGLAYPVAI